MAKLHFRLYIPNQPFLFPQRIDENIPANDSVRIVNAIVDNLNIESFKKLYKETGRCAHPKMMPKVIIYAYMNNICSCRKIEKLLLHAIHYIWLSGNGHPDFITVNRFRNRVKEEVSSLHLLNLYLLGYLYQYNWKMAIYYPINKNKAA